MDVTGRLVLVTGASSGIGRATAVSLAAAGARVLVTGRDRDALAEVAAAARATALPADLADPAEVHRLAAAVPEHGTLDVLVNNAGVGWKGAFAGMAVHDLERLLAVNVHAPLLLTRLLVEPMVQRRQGSVVFVTSIAGLTAVAQEAVYSASKGAVEVFAAALRAEVRPHGIHVSTVAPGVVATPFFERRGTPYDRSIPRPLSPERVADVVVRAVREGGATYVVPRWLTLPARLRGALPGVYRRLAERFGE